MHQGPSHMDYTSDPKENGDQGGLQYRLKEKISFKSLCSVVVSFVELTTCASMTSQHQWVLSFIITMGWLLFHVGMSPRNDHHHHHHHQQQQIIT